MDSANLLDLGHIAFYALMVYMLVQTWKRRWWHELAAWLLKTLTDIGAYYWDVFQYYRGQSRDRL